MGKPKAEMKREYTNEKKNSYSEKNGEAVEGIRNEILTTVKHDFVSKVPIITTMLSSSSYGLSKFLFIEVLDTNSYQSVPVLHRHI